MDRIKSFSKVFVFFAILFILISFPRTSFSQEKLNLTGIIRAVDPITGIVKIQVTSENCKGLWNFKFPDYAKEDLDSSMVGKKIQFNIESPACDPKRLHSIVLER